MNEAALAGLVFLGVAATAMAVFGITYLCTHKDKPPKSTYESSATDLDKLNPKNSQGKVVKNKKNDNSMNPTIKSLNPSDVLEKSALKTKYGEKIYKKGNKEIRLHRQKGLTCGICAAAFAICASGKTSETDVAKVVDKAIKEKHLDTGTDLDTVDIIGILNMYNIDKDIECRMGLLKSNDETYLEGLLKDCINNNSVLIINFTGHWVTICGYSEDGFYVYDSLYGRIIKMTAKDIFNRLPIPTTENMGYMNDGSHTKEYYNNIWKGKKILHALEIRC